MTRAEERALEAYPYYTAESIIEVTNARHFFAKGYEQAEKDLALAIEELDRVFYSRVVLEPNEDMATFQVSMMVSYALLMYLKKHEDGFKMLADQIVSELKSKAAKL